MVEAGLLVSMGDPSSCDTPATAGSEVSAISGLREAERNNNTGINGLILMVNLISNQY